MGFENLYGIELQGYAVEIAKSNTKGINVIQGSGFDLPFKDQYFDLVCTNGVLIHIDPKDHESFMREIIRCTSKFILGWEYFSNEITSVDYRGHQGYLWKADFVARYLEFDPDLHIESRSKINYIHDPELQDEIFLLKK